MIKHLLYHQESSIRIQNTQNLGHQMVSTDAHLTYYFRVLVSSADCTGTAYPAVVVE